MRLPLQIVVRYTFSYRLMNVGVQPILELLEFAPLNLAREIRDVLCGLFKQLSRNHGPEGIAGEVAESPATPMDILKNSLLVAGRSNA